MNGDFPNSPENVAAREGSQAIFNCTRNFMFQINWQFYPLSGNNVVTVASCPNAYYGPSPGYYTENISEAAYANVMSCNLILPNVTIDQAGLYQCSTYNDGPVAAQLTVIGKNSIASINNYKPKRGTLSSQASLRSSSCRSAWRSRRRTANWR